MRHLTKSSSPLAVAAVALCLPLLSGAHPIDPASAADPKLQSEIQAFRKQFQVAAEPTVEMAPVPEFRLSVSQATGLPATVRDAP